MSEFDNHNPGEKNSNPSGVPSSASDPMEAQRSDKSNDLTLSVPPANQNQVVFVEPGTTIHLGFDLSEAVVEQTGSTVVFRFDNGASLSLENVAAVSAEDSLAHMILPDGNTIPIAAFLASLDNSELAPAAGQANPSGGAGQNEEAPGSALSRGEKLEGPGFKSAPPGKEWEI